MKAFSIVLTQLVRCESANGHVARQELYWHGGGISHFDRAAAVTLKASLRPVVIDTSRRGDEKQDGAKGSHRILLQSLQPIIRPLDLKCD